MQDSSVTSELHTVAIDYQMIVFRFGEQIGYCAEKSSRMDVEAGSRLIVAEGLKKNIDSPA